ncbi:hypothetical protein G9444_3068 [Rhodococcus erythropolis]|uniref:Uncharacterized protein n=1 Tax=Rhodococcus erythropolis TaxID=1833 RepID=A0A6G9CTX9_RHOER|nr:hypothetical protein G9444_3068 [Rhodococcus erythropolis]
MNGIDVGVFGRNGRTSGKYPPVVKHWERLCFAGQNGIGDHDVRGQFSPGVEAWATNAVLAERRQIEMVGSRAHLGDFPHAQWDAFGEYRNAVEPVVIDPDHSCGATYADTRDLNGVDQSGQFDIVLGRQERRQLSVAFNPDVCHSTTVPQARPASISRSRLSKSPILAVSA